jgi:hypothetical protein
MAISISFENNSGEPVTDNQALLLDWYYKVYRDNGIKKKIECITDGQVTGVEYFKSPGESDAAIFEQLSPVTSIEISEVKASGIYSVELTKKYLNGVLKLKTRSLYLTEKVLCFQDLDLVTDQPILSSTDKYYYESNGEWKYHFDYDANGDVDRMTSFGGANSGYYSPDELPTLLEFNWSSLTYYHHALPFMP